MDRKQRAEEFRNRMNGKEKVKCKECETWFYSDKAEKETVCPGCV